VILAKVRQTQGCHYGLFFIRSIYYMMQTIFTIGYGDDVVPNGENEREMFMACCFMLVGVFGYGLIIANMTSVLANIDVVSMRYRHEMDMLSKWMVIRSMPDSLRERINIYFHYVFRKQKGMLDKDLFHDLPFTLKNQFAQMHNDMIIKVPFFNADIRSEHFIYTISNALEDRIYAPSSYLMYQFETQRELFIVLSGRCDIHIKGTKDAVSSLTPGDFIGDYQLLFGTVNQVGVWTPDFTEVLVLTFDAFEEFCDNPAFAFLNFRELGCNFRNSDDKGAIDTLANYDQFIKKLTAMVSTVKKGSKNNKLKDMMQKAEVVVHGIMVYPHDKVHVYWDILLLATKTLYCIMVPVRICWNLTDGGFSDDVKGLDGLKDSFDMSLILEYIFDIAYWLDMLGQMYCFAYVDHDMGSEVVVDRQMIATRYKNSQRYSFDIITAIPYDILGGAFGYWSLWRIPKMLRITYIFNNVNRLQKHFEDSMQVTLTETHVSVIIMSISTLILILWSSVGWNISRNMESDKDNRENFMKSVYWSFTTFTTVGYGDITPNSQSQTIYAIIIGAFGAIICAAIIANVTSFVHDVDVSEDNVEHKVNCLKWFLEGHNVSFEFIEKVQDYFDHVERDQEGLNEDTMLVSSVPTHLRHDILVHITSPMVLKSNFFKGCESGFLRKMMLSLEQNFYSTLFMIMNKSPATGMYFIKSGIVEMMTDKNGILILNTRLTADDSFAEGSLLEHWTENPFVARAGTDCELWFLSRSNFNTLVNDFPEIRSKLKELTNKANESKKRSCTILKKQTILLSSEKVQLTKFFVHPDNLFINVWKGVVLLFTLNSLIMVPFRTAFLENYELSASIAFDYIGDLIFLADSVIQMNFLGYYDDGHLIIDAKHIREHFKKSGFYYGHIVSALPLDFIAFFVTPFCPFGKLQLWSLLRLNKCFRIREVSRMTSDLEAAASRGGIKLNKNGLRVSKLIIVILISAHWLGGIFFILGNADQYSGGMEDSSEPRNWLQAHGNLVPANVTCSSSVTPTSDTLRSQYVAALYWAVATLTTVGYGDVTAVSNNEVFFATIVLILGTGIYTIVIANLEDIVSQLDVTSSLYKMKRDSITDYMDMQGLPHELKQKVNSYYNVCWTTQKGINGKKLLNYMSRAMRSELLFEMLNDLMSQMFFIKDCTSDFVSIVLERLTFDIYTKGDILFRCDEQADTVFIIHSGDVDLLTGDGVKFKTVSSSILGDGNFFLREPHICTAKAASNCEIFQLTFEDFWTCLHHGSLSTSYLDYLEENQKSLHKFSAMVNKMKNNLNSSKMAKMMDTGQDDSIPKHIILPNSKPRRIWDSVACLLTTVLVVIIPYRICFADKKFAAVWLVVDILLDLFFVVDIYLRMKHFAEMKDG
jgi:CRP-like cAMP-binding protein